LRSNCSRVITFDSHLKIVTKRRAARYLIGRMKKNKRALRRLERVFSCARE